MTLTLTLREPLAAPLETVGLRPDQLAGLSRASIERMQLRYGNRPVSVGELFDVSGAGEEDVRIEGDLRRATHLGAGMTAGRLVIAVTGGAASGAPGPGGTASEAAGPGGGRSGAAGTEVGARMAGGELVVEGDAGDWAGAGMRGGRLVVRGSAGRRLGGAHPGARAGMRGGEIVVHGDAGEEAGAGLRRGLIAVAGALGAAAGVRALAGTLVALGGVGPRPGAGMRRATIVAMAPVTPLPTYARACAYRPAFLRVVLGHLRALGLPVTDEQLAGRYARWCGDALELNRGEILVLEP